MRKGTTPTLIFTLPFASELIATAKVTFCQLEKVKLEKHTKDFTMKDNTLSLKLTQAETFLFNCNENIRLQLRVVTTSGEALATDVYTVFVSECLDGEVI